MTKSCFIHLFLLITTVKWMLIFCGDSKLYGVVLVVVKSQLTGVLSYRYTPKGSEKTDEALLLYKEDNFVDTALVQYEKEIDKILTWEPITKTQIFFKLLYSPKLEAELTKEQFNKIVTDATELAERYLKIQHISPVELYTSYIDDILIFGCTNIDIGKEIVTSSLTIIYAIDKLFIGFTTEDPELYPPEIIHSVNYKSNPYSVMANTFTCATEYQVNLLILQKIIQTQGKSELSYSHPCMPTNHIHTIEPNELISSCSIDLYIEVAAKFHGSFDEQECIKLINEVVTQKGIMGVEASKKSNFAGIKLPFSIDSISRGLVMYNDVIYHAGLGEHILVELERLQNLRCHAIDQLSPASNVMCFKVIYFKYVLEKVVGFSGKNVVTKMQEYPYHNKKRLAYIDPRVGFLISSVETEESAKSSTTSTTPTTSTMAKLSKGIQAIIGICTLLPIVLTAAIIFFIVKYKNLNDFENRL